MDIVSYILSKKYVEDSLAGAGALAGKSAYEIATDNGFQGGPWFMYTDFTASSTSTSISTRGMFLP